MPITGPRRLPYRLALSESEKSRWLSAAKSAFAASSWLKTWTTFCPPMISSMKPSSVASECCWATMYREDAPPSLRVTSIMTATTTTTRIVSHRL